MFRTIFVTMALIFAIPAFAGQWWFIADTEGGVEYYIFYNETGTLLNDPRDQNEILIIKLPEASPLNEDGGCSFDNCRIRARINGRMPNQGEAVIIEFSNGFALNFRKGQNADELTSNFTTAGMGATNYFDEYIRTNDWVKICFSDDCHQFDLAGSAQAANEVLEGMNQ